MAPSAEQFRELFLLDPEVTYLNHGSFGALPRPVFEAQNELRFELELEPVLFLVRKLPARLARVRQSVARFVRAASGDDIGLVPNVTTGLNAVARSIGLSRGDEILVTDHEYGAKRILWDEIASLAGAKIVVAPLPRPAQSEDDLFDAVAARFTPRTRVLFVSHITSLSALVLPVARLSALAREHGVLSIVDGAHGPGQVDLDLPSIGCDIYAGNLHKWVCAPRGSAFVWATPEAQSWLRGPVVSWDWSWSGPGAFQGRFGWAGTTDPTALLSVPAAFRFQREHAWRQVRGRCRLLALATVEALETEVGAVPLAAAGLRAPQMSSFSIPCPNPDDVRRYLWQRHRIEIPGEKFYDLSLLRLSVQAYTREVDCERLVEALRKAIRRRRAR
jgi:isopenicillin-N epimerase